MKRCPGCGVTSDDFATNKRRGDGLQSECRSCRRARDAATWEKRSAAILAKRKTPEGRRQRQAARHGLTVEQLEAMIAKYDGLCWICKENQGAEVDHCHATERRRGWLCSPCNIGLAGFRDQTVFLLAAVDYLGA